MTDRERALHIIAPGDIFHGESLNGASLICLTLGVYEKAIVARTVTGQGDLVFDRKTGVTASGNNRIDSVAPLPPDVHHVMLQFDWKSRFERNPERIRLSEEEKHALKFVARFYPANPLPGDS